jgi:hypothetical protein
MALLLGKLAAKPFDENGLRDRVDVKKHDQSDQAKNNIYHLDLEDGAGAAPYCWQAKSGEGKDEENSDKNRVTPDPPIAPLYLLKFACELLVSGLHGSRDRGYAGGNHGVEVRGSIPLSAKVVSPRFRVKTAPF